jgi:glycyl-tRNA synthetase beta chain
LKLSIDTVVHAWDGRPNAALAEKMTAFLLDRLGVQLRDEGVRHDFIAASRDWTGQPDMRIDRVEARARALTSFIETDNGTNLLAGYKRAANILKKEEWGQKSSVTDQVRGDDGIDGMGEEDPLALAGKPEFDEAMTGAESQPLSYTPEKAEKALIDALDAAAPKAAHAVSEERFEDAMAALATLRVPIDAFFEEVTVNDDNPDKRTARLNLLARFTRAVGNVADFSKIEG